MDRVRNGWESDVRAQRIYCRASLGSVSHKIADDSALVPGTLIGLSGRENIEIDCTTVS